MLGSTFGADLKDWGVSMIENMDYVFSHAYSFNGDLSNWDVSSATSMYGMFAHSQDFEGDGLETWNTGNVKDMQGVFWEARKFNGKISNWNTTSATTMRWMFDKAKKFDQDISRVDLPRREHVLRSCLTRFRLGPHVLRWPRRRDTRDVSRCRGVSVQV